MYFHQGSQRKKVCRTYEEAVDVKATLRTEKRDGRRFGSPAPLTFEAVRDRLDRQLSRAADLEGLQGEHHAGATASRSSPSAPPVLLQVAKTLAEIEPRDVRRSSSGCSMRRCTAARRPWGPSVRHVAALKALLATASRTARSGTTLRPAFGSAGRCPGARAGRFARCAERWTRTSLRGSSRRVTREWRAVLPAARDTGLRISEADRASVGRR